MVYGIWLFLQVGDPLNGFRALLKGLWGFRAGLELILIRTRCLLYLLQTHGRIQKVDPGNSGQYGIVYSMCMVSLGL